MKLKKSLIIIISLMVALTFLNILQDTYTGKITSSYNVQKFTGSITVTPNIALTDETITIDIKGPYYKDNEKLSYGKLSNKIYFYKDGLRKDEVKICITSRCKGNFTKEFTIPATMYTESKWQDGTYTAKTYDYLNKKYLETSFIVTNESNPNIGCKEIDDYGDKPYKKSEIISYYTGKKIKKEDKCFTDKIIIEYYCCKDTDLNYKKDLGMCEKQFTCLNKCYGGACFS